MKSEAEYFAFVGGSIPTPAHQQEGKVGMENRRQINRLPTIPTIPTANDSDGATVVGPDIGGFEERAAIAEHDGEQSRHDAETLAAQEQAFEEPADLHQAAVNHWASEIERIASLGATSLEGADAIARAQRFISEGWALQAARLGWDELDLFGVCPRAPWQRLDRKGAAFRGAVQAVTREAVVYVGGLRRYRAMINNDGGAVPIWDMARDGAQTDEGDAS